MTSPEVPTRRSGRKTSSVQKSGSDVANDNGGSENDGKDKEDDTLNRTIDDNEKKEATEKSVEMPSKLKDNEENVMVTEPPSSSVLKQSPAHEIRRSHSKSPQRSRSRSSSSGSSTDTGYANISSNTTQAKTDISVNKSDVNEQKVNVYHVLFFYFE